MFTLIKTQGAARRGRFQTVHGTVETPVFMNVATVAAIKGALSSFDLAQLKCQVELCNTYHLHLRPGDELVAEMVGLRAFMGWQGPVLTDSGGFQVFSLAALRQITEQGVQFSSHIDGRRIFMGPEESMRIQSNLGSTFGINQGGTYADLRVEHMKQLAQLDCEGFAIGGLAVGEPAPVMYDIIEHVEPYMPKDKPRYLMGVGTPVNILEGVARGVDFFDCVMPSRNARHGHLNTWNGVINLNNARYARDDGPIDAQCDCPVCRRYSRAYLRHLLRAGEMLGMRLCVMHNLYFYNTLTERIRAALDEGRFDEFYRQNVPVLDVRI